MFIDTVGSPRSPERARRFLRRRLARAASEDRGVPEANGLDYTVVLFVRDRLQLSTSDRGPKEPKVGEDQDGEQFGLSALLRDGGEIYRTYFTTQRGVEGLNTWTFFDLTPFGRQEDWVDSPEGYPQTKPYEWWRRHDEYGK
jgi:predicted dithiol-disulfide oxidoreductase (DUF899 family)